MEKTNLITAQGYAALKTRYDFLLSEERPRIVDIVSWAAGNGDRSENGDYIYGRKKMREIDRELNRLAKKMKHARIIDPAAQPDKERVFFGAIVTLTDEDGKERIVQLVGNDEADAANGKIGWGAPISRAIRGAKIGDERAVRLPSGEKYWEITAIAYPS